MLGGGDFWVTPGFLWRFQEHIQPADAGNALFPIAAGYTGTPRAQAENGTRKTSPFDGSKKVAVGSIAGAY